MSSFVGFVSLDKENMQQHFDFLGYQGWLDQSIVIGKVI